MATTKTVHTMLVAIAATLGAQAQAQVQFSADAGEFFLYPSQIHALPQRAHGGG